MALTRSAGGSTSTAHGPCTSYQPARYAQQARRAIPLALIALGLALASYQLGADSLWSDEIVTGQITRRTLSEMWAAMRADPNHFPLYYLLEWAFSWSGRTEWALRLPSALAASLAVVATYRLGCELLGTSAGIAAAALLMAHPTHLWAAQEARYYALVGAATALSAAALLRLLRLPRPATAATFLFAALAALYTHFFCLLPVAVEALLSLALLLRPRGLTPRARRLLVVAWLALVPLSLPLVPYVLRLLHFEAGGVSGRMLTPSALRALWLEYGLARPALAAALSALALAGLVLSARRRPAAALLAAVWFAPLLPLLALRSTHFFLNKYVYFLLPMYVALAAAGWAAIAESIVSVAELRYLSPFVALAALLLALPSLPGFYRTEKFDWRAAASRLASLAGPEDAVIMLPPAEPEMAWYYEPSGVAPVVPFGYGRHSLPALLAAEQSSRALYWVVLAPQGRLPEQETLASSFDVEPYFGVVVLRSRVPALQAAAALLPLFARGAGSDAVLAAPAWDTLGAVYERLGDEQGAAEAYGQALALFHEERVRHRLSGDLARLRGDWAVARAEYEEAVLPVPDLPEVYLNLARARRQTGDRQGAVSACLAYRRLTGEWPPGLCLVEDLLAELPKAGLDTPQSPLETPFCRSDAPDSCYVAQTAFTLPSTGESHPVLFAHPPAAVEYRIDLTEDAYLAVWPLLDPQSWGWGGDGAVFEVSVTVPGGATRLLGQRLVTPADREWREWLLPLADWAGTSVLLRLETTPGEAGNAQADWAGWGQPLIVALCERQP